MIEVLSVTSERLATAPDTAWVAQSSPSENKNCTASRKGLLRSDQRQTDILEYLFAYP